MKGMVALAFLLIGAGIIYVMVRRPTVGSKTVTGPSTSNQIFGVLGSIGSNLVGAFANSGSKIGAPSGVTGASTQPIVNEGTYQTEDTTVTGNTLTNDAGQTLTYGTD